jgi:cystathionine beta-lyase
MDFDFDRVIDRRGTHAVKWDGLQAYFGVDPEGAIPMWVADMDFLPPPAVNAALARALAHGIHGYYGDDRSYRAAIVGWMARRHGWTVDPDWILTVHGLVAGTALAIQAFSAPGDAVILFTPVYHAFHRIIRANGREILQCPMPERDGRYVMDLDALATRLTGRERLLILCSPHNPGGRVWTAAELAALAEFCAAHRLILLSDEVHHDLTMPGVVHTPIARAAPGHLDRIVTMSATSKTFNLAGGMTGNLIVPDPALRARLRDCILAAGGSPNRFGMLMAEAAYAEGDAWLDALRLYLDGNRRRLDAGLEAIPGVRSMRLEATYLAWADFRGTGLPEAETIRRFEQVARVVGNHGATFGEGGAGWMRLNFACPRAMVEEAIGRLQAAFRAAG